MRNQTFVWKVWLRTLRCGQTWLQRVERSRFPSFSATFMCFGTSENTAFRCTIIWHFRIELLILSGGGRGTGRASQPTEKRKRNFAFSSQTRCVSQTESAFELTENFAELVPVVRSLPKAGLRKILPRVHLEHYWLLCLRKILPRPFRFRTARQTNWRGGSTFYNTENVFATNPVFRAFVFQSKLS